MLPIETGSLPRTNTRERLDDPRFDSLSTRIATAQARNRDSRIVKINTRPVVEEETGKRPRTARERVKSLRRRLAVGGVTSLAVLGAVEVADTAQNAFAEASSVVVGAVGEVHGFMQERFDSAPCLSVETFTQEGGDGNPTDDDSTVWDAMSEAAGDDVNMAAVRDCTARENPGIDFGNLQPGEEVVISRPK